MSRFTWWRAARTPSPPPRSCWCRAPLPGPRPGRSLARCTASELCPSTTPSSRQVQHQYFLQLHTILFFLCIAGGYNYKTGVTYDTVLKFDSSSLVWTEVGRMRQPRTMHGASVARLEDMEQYCGSSTGHISICSQDNLTILYFFNNRENQSS